MKSKIPFIGPSYAYPGLPTAIQESLNYYLEVNNTEAREPVALRGCPGLTAEESGLSGNIKCLFESNDLMLVASGDKIYKIDTSFNSTEIGSISNLDRYWAVDGPDQVLFCDVPISVIKGYAMIPHAVTKGYVYTKSTGVLAEISDSDFKPTTKGFSFFLSNNENYLSYEGLDFDSANIYSDDIIGICKIGSQAAVFGRISIEFWYFSGNSTFPIAQQTGASIHKGAIGKKCIAEGDNTIFWIGNDLCVYMLNGFSEYKISNLAVDKAISDEPDKENIEGFYHFWHGHKFYCIALPTSKTTWVFDAILSGNPNIAWHNRQSWNKDRWRANSFAYFNNKHIVGDYEQGKIYSMSSSVYTDDGGILEASRTGNYLHADDRSIKLPEFQLDMDLGHGITGSNEDPRISLRITRDKGKTWSKERSRSLGKNGEYNNKIVWKNNGKSRSSMAIKTTITDDCPRDIIACTGRVVVDI